MNKTNRIFVVGHVAAGKGVLAQAIAKNLGWRFVDADSGIEYHMGANIQQGLGTDGAQAFLSYQERLLSHLLSQNNIVVATDGCIALNKNNRQHLQSEFVVHLRVSEEIQSQRLADNHPILLSNDEVDSYLKTLHQDRDDMFEQLANISISSDDGKVDTHVSSVVNALAS